MHVCTYVDDGPIMGGHLHDPHQTPPFSSPAFDGGSVFARDPHAHSASASAEYPPAHGLSPDDAAYGGVSGVQSASATPVLGPVPGQYTSIEAGRGFSAGSNTTSASVTPVLEAQADSDHPHDALHSLEPLGTSSMPLHQATHL
jgi:hypothetical protein